MTEQTLVLIKPDGVQRCLIGEIIVRLERVGLKIVALSMVHATRDQADQHYALTEEWMRGVFKKAKEKYETLGRAFPYDDPVAYGTFIKNGLIEFLTSGPIVALVLEGEQSVALVRKITGATEPASAAPGTIRGDLSLDTYGLSNSQHRPLRNLIHASGTVEEAKVEISVWFSPQEIFSIHAAIDPIQYDEKRFCVS